MNGHWLLPTRKRLSGVRRFLRALREIGSATPGILLVNAAELEADRRHYSELDIPQGWKIEPVENDNCMFDCVRWAFDNLDAGNWDWIGLLSDDLIPGTPGWDTSIISALNGHNVVSGNPIAQVNRMHGAIAWSGDLIRALGWNSLYPPGFNHWYGDDVWETIAQSTSCWQVLNDVVTKHNHASYSGNPDETTAWVNRNAEHDKARFEQWSTNERDWDIEKIKQLQIARGVKIFTPDFKGVHLLISCPSVDGRYHDTFMIGLFQTMGLLRQHGGLCDFIQEKYNADIALARSRLFGAFVRHPTATHMLMIDSDMGWTPEAVIRVFSAKKDMVAIAGPKKSYPLRFAANHTDAKGNPLPLMMDVNLGVCEVTEVGAAFMLITKGCANKIANGYPELQFAGITGDVDYGVFNPMIMRGNFKSEDFAFCNRWIAVGGKVWLVPDVALTHSGQHTFAGKLTDQTANANPVADQMVARAPTAHMQAAE